MAHLTCGWGRHCAPLDALYLDRFRSYHLAPALARGARAGADFPRAQGRQPHHSAPRSSGSASLPHFSHLLWRWSVLGCTLWGCSAARYRCFPSDQNSREAYPRPLWRRSRLDPSGPGHFVGRTYICSMQPLLCPSMDVLARPGCTGCAPDQRQVAGDLPAAALLHRVPACSMHVI